MGGGQRGGVRTETLDRQTAAPEAGGGGVARQTLEWSPFSSSPTLRSPTPSCCRGSRRPPPCLLGDGWCFLLEAYPSNL